MLPHRYGVPLWLTVCGFEFVSGLVGSFTASLNTDFAVNAVGYAY